MAGSQFEGTRAQGADFSRAALQNARFHFSELSGALFAHAVCKHVQATRSQFASVDFADAVFESTEFNECDLTGARIPNPYGAVFRGRSSRGWRPRVRQ
jgi:uncharacterized protein YjbI with pentapeptide repeats